MVASGVLTRARRVRPSIALRLVGAAVGASLSTIAAAALVLLDPFFALVPLVGAPVAGLLGFLGAPFVLGADPRQTSARAAFLALVAVAVGLTGYSAWDAMRHGWEYLPTNLIVYSGVSVLFGLPVALLVAIPSAHLLRGLRPHAANLVTPTVLVLCADALAVLVMIPSVLRALRTMD